MSASGKIIGKLYMKRSANDAAVTVRGAELVSLRELLESENTETSAREME